MLFLTVVAHSCTQEIKTHEYIFNTAEFEEYPIKLSDTTVNSKVLIQIWNSKIERKPDSIPGANVFMCRINKLKDTARTHPDTVIVLDMTPIKQLKNINLSEYWVEIKESRKLKKCKVDLPPAIYAKLKKYKYQYGQVTLATDD